MLRIWKAVKQTDTAPTLIRDQWPGIDTDRKRKIAQKGIHTQQTVHIFGQYPAQNSAHVGCFHGKMWLMFVRNVQRHGPARGTLALRV